MATKNNRTDDVLSTQQEESASGANKYRGLALKKKPLISQDPKRTWFDSADWALHKQEASPDERTIAAIENLKPKYFHRTSQKELPPTVASGQDNQTDSSV
ncbi:cAMP-regulated phosphoprotein 19-related protein [Hirschfeldia incana]|nr:cAMP-regulated phosphoprotein 19-related protein [Hirschfeldia incana]